MKCHQIFESLTIAKQYPQSFRQYLSNVVKYLKQILHIPTNVSINILPSPDLDKTQNGTTLPNFNVPNSYTIYLKPSLIPIDILSALSHEMVHIKQLNSNKLRLEYKNKKLRMWWEGEELPISNIKYSRSHPWEIEAHKLERDLLNNVIQHVGNYHGR